MNTLSKQDVTAAILTGGKGRRMQGKDKGLVELADRPLIEYVIAAIKPQVNTIIINANRNQLHYARYAYPVFADNLENYQGPLAGFISVMKKATTSHLVTLPCDGPLIAADFVERLIAALKKDKAEIAVAHDGERLQPVHALIPITLSASLDDFLDSGERKIDLWYKQHKVALADFSDCAETFRNINTTNERDDLQKEGLLQ